MTGRTGLVPLDVDDKVLPAVRLQVCSEVIGLGLGLRFGKRRAETIPTVPAQGRALGPQVKSGLSVMRATGRSDEAEYER